MLEEVGMHIEREKVDSQVTLAKRQRDHLQRKQR